MMASPSPGLSVEHLHDHVGCRTIFATHYHELMQLPEKLAHARNFNVAVRENRSAGSFFCTGLNPGGLIAPTASMWPNSPACHRLLSFEHGRSLAPSGNRASRLFRSEAPADPDPAQPSLFDSPAGRHSRLRNSLLDEQARFDRQLSGAP